MDIKVNIPIAPPILHCHTTDMNIVEKFLHDVNMHPDAVDMDREIESLMDEMGKGLRGEKSSLPMIPTYIEAQADIPLDTPAVVLDAGGTNLRAAQITFTADGSPRIENFHKQAMPGTQGNTISRKEMFDTLAGLVEPLLIEGGRIGFCFSYPTEAYPNKDGRLINWTKEIKAPEVVDSVIGVELKAALRRKGIKNPPEVIILNDSVATLLAGKALHTYRPWGAYLGFILGTGVNVCYLESNAAIGKIPGLNFDKHQIINCEIGSYACPIRGEGDIMLGTVTGESERCWLEKMISGAYFGILATQTTLLAGQKGIISDKATQALAKIGTFSTKDADIYCHNPFDTHDNPLAKTMNEAASADDMERLWLIFDALLERAARLSAVILGAAILKGPYGTGSLKPVGLAIDGTTFYCNYRFQHRVEAVLRPYMTARNKYYETLKVEDAPLIGAAAAALSE